MINKIRKEMFRKQLRKNNFFEGITFENKELEEVVSECFFCMKKYINIEFKRFTKLFCNWEEIILPVIIRKEVITSSSIRLIIIDSEEKEYYMGLHRKYYFKINEYDIGRRGNILDRNIDRQLCFKISKENKIVLDTSYAGLLNEDGTNRDITAKIYYDIEQEIATASIEDRDNKIVISYKAEGNSIDNNVIDFLLNIRENNCYKDVLPILKDFVTIIGNRKDIISVETRVNERVYSKVCIEKGTVTEYSYSKDGEEGKNVMITSYSPSNIII